jgi:uncharacterized protein YaaN involved in tellurite resistance
MFKRKPSRPTRAQQIQQIGDRLRGLVAKLAGDEAGIRSKLRQLRREDNQLAFEQEQLQAAYNVALNEQLKQAFAAGGVDALLTYLHERHDSEQAALLQRLQDVRTKRAVTQQGISALQLILDTNFALIHSAKAATL